MTDTATPQLKELTPEQLAQLPLIAQEWLDIKTCTDPCDMDKCVQLLKQIYANAGLAEPAEFIYMPSPTAADNFIREHPDMPATFGVGPAEIGCIARYDAYNRFGATFQKILPWIQLMKECEWVATYDEAAIVQDRPRKIELEIFGRPVDSIEQKRLHCEDGMALMYADGTGEWRIHGILVDEQLVMRPETQSLDQIVKEKNEEIKRLRIERFGVEDFLLLAGATTIDQRENAIEATREQLLFCEKLEMVYLSTFCPSTSKLFFMEVGLECKTCAEAQSWLWNLPGTEADLKIVGRT